MRTRCIGCEYLFGMALLFFLTPTARAQADDGKTDALWKVTLAENAESPCETIEGRILVEAQDGGILLEDRAGVFWNITPVQQIQCERTEGSYTPLRADELAVLLKGDVNDPVEVVTTEHYVIATAGSRLHAEWCGVLFERLMKAFLDYWNAPELNLRTPTAPLPVVIYRDRTSFAKVAQKDAGPAFAQANGYYSMKTNRIVLFDPTGERKPLRSRAELQRYMLANPVPVSTIVHEATHQIAFNCGMHTRYADNPVWMTEGMAMYFEVPDLRSRAVWRTMGRVNQPRLRAFRDAIAEDRVRTDRRGIREEKTSGPLSHTETLALRLEALVADDGRFQDFNTNKQAYAEAWLLTHYLLNNHRKNYLAYLSKCSDNTHLDWKAREQRLQEFKEAFGILPGELSEHLLRYAARFGK